ncbi:Spo0E family sporulation regulatory protein-aspartic acid phosphatase [Halobacillus seohaensis]|uniref:Spo0E family sporulation regulatory protein-aspartic acid phosphatase n=1 Tax=Halobacillus seohaensis TaxID=447421 RepID=A0ABW2EKT1_9BACI
MNKIQILEDKIEQVRFKMYNYYTKNPSDFRVLEVSRELDELLNQLNKEMNVLGNH